MQNILEKLKLIQENPGFYKGLTPEEQAELFIFLLTPKPLLKKKPTIKLKDGYTPVPDKDYLAKETALALFADIQAKVDAKLATITNGKDGSSGRDGKDAEVTPALIEDIILEVTSRIVFPDGYDDTSLQETIANLSLDHEQLRDEVETLKNRLIQVGSAGTIGKGQVYGWIRQAVSDGTIPSGSATWDYYATNWSVAPTLNSSITGGDVYDYTLDGTTRYRFVPTTYDATQDAFYSTFSGGLLSGIIVTRG